MLSMPNVNMAQEMVDLITSSRTYEANLSVVKSSRQMAMKTLEIGRT
jgi:flagellar basal-body rod protein FlgC